MRARSLCFSDSSACGMGHAACLSADALAASPLTVVFSALGLPCPHHHSRRHIVHTDGWTIGAMLRSVLYASNRERRAAIEVLSRIGHGGMPIFRSGLICDFQWPSFPQHRPRLSIMRPRPTWLRIRRTCEEIVQIRQLRTSRCRKLLVEYRYRL